MKNIKKFGLVACLILSPITIMSLVSCGEATPSTSIEAGALSINVSGNTSVEEGQTITLRVSLQNDASQAGYTSTSSDEAIATVNGNKVTGVSAGKCTITFTANGDSSVKKEYEITVTKKVDATKITVSISGQPTTSPKVGDTFTLTATVNGADGATPTYKWASKNYLSTISNSKTETATVKVNTAGEEKIELTVKLGTSEIVEEVNLVYTENYDSFIKIGSKADFETNILNAGPNLDSNYCLTADIDLEGMKIDGFASKLNLNGTLDGKGHKISNFEIISTDPDKANSALIQNTSTTGKIANLAVSGTIGAQGAGWGTALLVNVHSGIIENCLVETKQEYNQGIDGWFPFNASLCGVLKEGASIKNSVVNVTSSCEGAGCNMAIAAYPAGGHQGLNQKNDQTFTVENIYTNQSEASSLGSVWDWGSPIENTDSIYCSVNFKNTAASYYTALNPDIWNLTDNAMPTLKVQA